MVAAVERLTFSDLRLGQEAAFEVVVEADDVDRFAALSGDVSPLHVSDAFAHSRGYAGRVVHGAYLTALVSRLVGVHLPGENCLLHGVNMQFRVPVLTGTRISVSGVVDQLSEAVRTAVIKVAIRDVSTGTVVATGKANIGFTQPRDDGPRPMAGEPPA